MNSLSRDRLLITVLSTAAFGVLALVLVIVGYLVLESWPALSQVSPSRWFFDSGWYPSALDVSGAFNLWPLLAASLLVTLGAVVVATPIALATAMVIFLPASTGKAAKAFAALLERVLELLAGIPSVVYGFWGLVVLVPLINQWQPPGQSLFAGILVLSLMILPTIALLSLTAFRDLPQQWRSAATALSMRPSTLLLEVLLPQAKRGIFVGVVLGLTRALGETMVVLMVCGNRVAVPGSLFDSTRTATANIALEMAYAQEFHRSALFVCGLMLMFLVCIAVFLTRFDDAVAEAKNTNMAANHA